MFDGWLLALRAQERELSEVEGGYDAPQSVVGERREELWRSGQLTGGHPVEVADVLGSELSDTKMRVALGETGGDLALRLGRHCHWGDTIEMAWAKASQDSRAFDTYSERLKRTLANHSTEASMLLWVAPLLWRYEVALNRQLLDCGIPRGGLFDAAMRCPIDLMMRPLSRAFVLELNLTAQDGILRGATPEDRYDDFVNRVLRQNGLEVLRNYPVLGRILVERLDGWVSNQVQFCSRFMADEAEVRDCMANKDICVAGVTDVEFGAGDGHRGGQSVCVVLFQGGSKVVYKPRDLATEQHFSIFLSWVNIRGARLPLSHPRVLNRGTRGWCEFIEPGPLECPEDGSQFFWRHGAFLAVLYVLGATDMHLENLIASGANPYVVDLESIFHATIRDSQDSYATALEAGFQGTVLYTGLLPQKIVKMDEDGVHALEVSGLAGGQDGASETPEPVLFFEGAGTDRFRMVRGRRPIKATSNRAVFNEEYVDAYDYREDILAGFRETYERIRDGRDDLLACGGLIDAFVEAPVRHILRDTDYYYRTLSESFHPDALTNGLDREALLACVKPLSSCGTAGIALVESERTQLWESDVPYFEVSADGRDLQDPYGRLYSLVRKTSGLESTRRRLGRLSSEDLERQVWCIEASLLTLQDGLPGVEERGSVPFGVCERVGPGSEADVVCGIADWIIANELVDGLGGRREWLSLELLGDRHWQVRPSGFGLYSGTAGVGLYLMEVANHLGHEMARQSACDIVKMAAEHVDVELSRVLDDSLSLGLYDELCGSALLFMRAESLGFLPGGDALINRILDRLSELVRIAPGGGDVVGGVSGAAIIASYAFEMGRTKHATGLLDICRTTILAGVSRSDRGAFWNGSNPAEPGLLGFAHGVAGNLVALTRIETCLGSSKEVREVVESGLAYENSWFDEGLGNWPDLRLEGSGPESMDAWCHGAGGIVLARAVLLESGLYPACREVLSSDIRRGLVRIKRDLCRGGQFQGIGNDSMCHGDVGLAECLFVGGAAVNDREAVDLSGLVVKGIAHRHLRGESLSGLPGGFRAPGLMVGTAGVGYGVLRFLTEGRVPSLFVPGWQSAHWRG